MRWRPESNKKRACNTETFSKDRQKETAAVRNKCTQVAICGTVSVCTAQEFTCKQVKNIKSASLFLVF